MGGISAVLALKNGHSTRLEHNTISITIVARLSGPSLSHSSGCIHSSPTQASAGAEPSAAAADPDGCALLARTSAAIGTAGSGAAAVANSLSSEVWA